MVRVRAAPAEPAAAQGDSDAVPPWEVSEDTGAYAGRPMQVDLAVDEVEEVTPETSAMVPVRGGIRVAMYLDGGEPAPTPACGDRLEMPLRLKPMPRYRDPGAFQYGDYLLGQGIALEANVAAARVGVISAGPASLRCRMAALQGWAAGRLAKFAGSAPNARLPRLLRVDVADARMLGAMLFGDRSGLTHGLRVGFERTGTFHLFVVSGLHIALLAAGVYWLLRRLRLPEWVATLLTIPVTAAYAVLTGFGQPAQRALVMTCVYLVARLLSRTRDPLNALGAAALVLLVWAPDSLFEASFQMTALVIVAIAGIAVPMSEWTFMRYLPATRDVFRPHAGPRRDAKEAQLVVMLELWGEAVAGVLGEWALRLPAVLVRVTLWALELALVGVVTELVMVLPMAVYFHRATVFGVPANMVVLPVVGVLGSLAVVTFVASLISPWLALLPGAATALLLHGVAWVIQRISHLALADVRLPGPVCGWVAGLALAGWLACCWLGRRGRRGAWLAALALPVIAAMVLWPEPAVRVPGVLEVTALDVGQGDSLLAVGPKGETMLIDAGGPVGRHGNAEVTSGFDVGEEVVAPYLWLRRVRRLDVVVLSHAHTDHMGGMPAILDDFRPRELWVGADSASVLYERLLAQAQQLGIVVRHLHAGDGADWGGVKVTALSPAPEYRNVGAAKNDDSLVLRMDYGKASVLLEGDAERPSEEAMLAQGLVQPVTLLKVGHHGSRTSSTQAFVDAAAPVDAVVSVGRRNTFGHPRGEVIARIAGEGAHLFRTDEFGMTTFLLREDGSIVASVAEVGTVSSAAGRSAKDLPAPSPAAATSLQGRVR